MNDATRATLVVLRFREHFPEAMFLRFECIDVRAVVHPCKGLVLMYNHAGPRTITEGESFLPEDASVAEIARAMLKVYGMIHPERQI